MQSMVCGGREGWGFLVCFFPPLTSAFSDTISDPLKDFHWAVYAVPWTVFIYQFKSTL